MFILKVDSICLLNITILYNVRSPVMRGALILTVFFLMFTGLSLLIPSPMFPGIFFCALLGAISSSYTEYLSAIINGIFYSVLLWIFFNFISKRLEKSNTVNY